MFPDFGTRKRREINLGGSSSAVTQASILDRARIQREQRIEQKRRTDNALVLQSWWRGVLEQRRTRRTLRAELECNPRSLNGLRCLVLIGADDEALGAWTEAVLEAGEGM
jgi:ubiquitin-protein ligase E3 C